MSAYLDHNAGSPVRPEAARAAERVMEIGGNPSSPHAWGRRARALLEEARHEVAALVGADAARVIFTSGGTEANHLAFGLARAMGAGSVLISAIEHPSILAAAAASGLECEYLAPSSEGVVSPEAALERLALMTPPIFVSIMLANNETGAIQPVAEIAAMTHEAGGIFHIDAIQAAGRLPIDIEALGADALSLSGHKMGALSGVGALILARDMPLTPLLTGGGQERGHRAGTENLAGVASMGAAAKCAASLSDVKRLRRLRAALEETLSRIQPEAVIFSQDAPRLPNTTAFALPALSAQAALIRFDLEGVALSAGAACSSGKIAPSHVLSAMGVSDNLASHALRASLGWNSTDEDVRHFARALVKIAPATHMREKEAVAI